MISTSANRLWRTLNECLVNGDFDFIQPRLTMGFSEIQMQAELLEE